MASESEAIQALLLLHPISIMVRLVRGAIPIFSHDLLNTSNSVL